MVSNKHLRAKTRLRSDQQGYRLRDVRNAQSCTGFCCQGVIMSLEELMEAEKSGKRVTRAVGLGRCGVPVRRNLTGFAAG